MNGEDRHEPSGHEEGAFRRIARAMEGRSDFRDEVRAMEGRSDFRDAARYPWRA